jgi:pimeloyl-ACP methyl ester carboxylesterase
MLSRQTICNSGALADDRKVVPASDDGSSHSVIRLAEAIISLRPLIDVLPQPVDLISDSGEIGSLPDLALLNHIASRLNAPYFEFSGEKESSVFSRIITARLACAEHLYSPKESASVDIDSMVDVAAGRSFEHYCDRAEISSLDRVPINVYAAGNPERKAVVIASICGMPAKLCEPWIRFLARDYFVITWESRGLFANSRFSKGLDCSIEAQTADAFAAMDHFRVHKAHFMGMCGGALIAMAAAAQQPARVSSLSTWHGDLELGPTCPKTTHQRDLQALMSMATEQRVSPRDLHFVLCQSMTANVPDDLAPLVLYPYASPELLFTYCRLNGNIMQTNATPYLSQIHQPTLVVTSEDDETAHPAGSKHAAAFLPHATLRVESHGNHICLFRGMENLLQIGADFIARTE